MNDPYRTPGVVERDEEKPVKRSWYELFETVFVVTLAGAFALTLVTVVAYPIFKLMTRTEQADYCYVAPDVQLVPDPENGRFSCGKHIDGYTLMQHVPWSSDRVLVMGVKTSEEIRKEAEAFKCPLR